MSIGASSLVFSKKTYILYGSSLKEVKQIE